MPFDDDKLATLLSLIEEARELDPSDPRYLKLEQSVAHLAKTAKKKRRLARARKAREGTQGHRPCYVCKQRYEEVHGGYHLLCPTCASHSEAMRAQPLPLQGRRALITGGRIKIGQAVALQMLRAGATVHVTTRFSRDAVQRYAAEPDAALWQDRLRIHALDLRDLGALLGLLERLRQDEPFDIVINNAAQSVWHPPELMAALHSAERRGERPALTELDRSEAAQGAAVSESALVPLHRSLEALDVERVDSWEQVLGEVAPIDMVEVTVVNAIAPFLLCSRLRDSLARSPFPDRYVVNVSAVEGQFERDEKSPRHPHTNMAKAALNMLTRTSASELARDGIYMVSVDPGWMSRERADGSRPDFRPPLDAVDSAARILHPIAQGIAGEPLYGVLLKDFAIVPW